MRAATHHRYGPPEVLAIEQFDRPSAKANEVLVHVYASSVTSGDVRIREFKGAGVFWLPLRLMFGMLRPRKPVPGMEFAGRIEAVGKTVTSLRIGDAVFGMTLRGANAEYVTIRDDVAITLKPPNLSDTAAAGIPFGAMSALAFLRDIVRIRAGEKLLIHGASGAVGVAAVQIAKHFGAEVTGVCSTVNLELVRSLGADHVIDYTTTDFTQGSTTYDAILDTVGGTRFGDCARVLTPTGRHVFVNSQLTQLLQMMWTSLQRGRRVICGFTSSAAKADIEQVKLFVENGVLKPVVDRIYSLDEIVAAHRYADSGRKRGSVIIKISDGPVASTLGA